MARVVEAIVTVVGGVMVQLGEAVGAVMADMAAAAVVGGGGGGGSGGGSGVAVVWWWWRWRW